MLNATVILKVKQRLNKLDSQDYDNIETWKIIEAFNKGTVDWCRRNLHGSNIKQTGDEQSKRRIDDLQVLLTEVDITLTKEDGYYESTSTLPANYFEWKRITGDATSDCCSDGDTMVITLAEEANVDEINRDFLKKPSFEWRETYCTLKDNRIRIHTNNEFDIPRAILSYYRQPRRIEVAGIDNPYNPGNIPAVDVISEFKDDVVELFIDEAVKILAADIESFNQAQTANQQVESNN